MFKKDSEYKRIFGRDFVSFWESKGYSGESYGGVGEESISVVTLKDPILMTSRKGQESFSVQVFYLKEEKKYLFLYSIKRCLGHKYSGVSKAVEGDLSDLLAGLSFVGIG